MMRRLTVGAAGGFAAALLVSALFATPVRAQTTPVKKDTTASSRSTAQASADTTDYQAEGLSEFEARRKAGGGYYLTRRQLRAERDRSLAEILTSHFPGIRIVYGSHLASEYLVSTRGEGPNALIANQGESLCYMQVFVDGAFVTDGDISWINPDNVAGIELYDATRTPPMYRRPDGQCGVLLVWSRTGY